MKTCMLTIIALGLIMTPAMARDRSGSSSSSTSGAGAASLANVAITNNGAKSVRTTGAAVAPGLASSGISCSNSGSMGAGWMGGALALGLPIKDRECDTRENAKVMGIIAGRPAAKETMCDIPKLAAVFARIGQPCVNASRSETRAVAYGAPRVRVASAAGSGASPERPTNCRNSSSKYCK